MKVKIGVLQIVLSYFICTIPIAVNIYMGHIGKIEFILSVSNSIVNPQIYFFKGYIEAYLAKHTSDPASPSSDASPSDNPASPSSEKRKYSKIIEDEHLKALSESRDTIV